MLGLEFGLGLGLVLGTSRHVPVQELVSGFGFGFILGIGFGLGLGLRG